MLTSKQQPAIENRAATFKSYRVYAVLVIFIVMTCGTTYVLYTKTQDLFRWSLSERLLDLASVASTNFNQEQLDQIKGSESVDTEIYKKVVLKLDEIRRRTKKVRYAYILRKTSDPYILEFVADADSLTPNIPKDLDGDGEITEDDTLVSPGDPYDVSNFQEFAEQAFKVPYVDPQIVQDQWGAFLSGHAPITDSENRDVESKYVIGLDLNVTEFQVLTNLALVPFAFFIIFLLLILTTLTVILKRMWMTQVQLLAELDRQKDELLSIVSHQLATPVSSVKWYIEMLLDGDLGKVSEEQKEHLTSVQSVCSELTDLVSMVLDVSRIQLGRIKVEKQEMDVELFFKEILEIIEPKAKEKGTDFRVAIPPHFPKAMLDKRYTKMTIENLLSNAVKYTPKDGKVEFNVSVSDNILHCSVKDTGCGIPKAEQDKIFGKMFRASNVRNEVDGNGFGLYIAKGAIEAQGGKIWFESTEGKGTTFFVTLPLQ